MRYGGVPQNSSDLKSGQIDARQQHGAVHPIGLIHSHDQSGSGPSHKDLVQTVDVVAADLLMWDANFRRCTWQEWATNLDPRLPLYIDLLFWPKRYWVHHILHRTYTGSRPSQLHRSPHARLESDTMHRCVRRLLVP